MRSPIPIEPMHLFSYGHDRQRNISRGCVRTNDDENAAQHGAHTGKPMQCSLQFAAYSMHAIWYWRSIS